MIRVEEISISEFRGIRDLTLKFEGKNFAVCGPNGTGKSGIVDAIEFAISGSISRLSGEGTKGISVKDHGPHVDCRDNPEKSSVTLTVYIPSLKKQAIIHRTVKKATTPKITPDSIDIKNVLERVALHPEFVLSRREIIKYVLAEAGKRSKEVQALLRLEELESLRRTLQKITNATDRELTTLTTSKNTSSDELKRAMSITRISEKEILEAGNQRRNILSLPVLTILEADTSLKDGLTAVGASNKTQIQKPIALSDIKAALDQSKEINGNEAQELCSTISNGISSLDNEALDSASREELLQNALRLYDDQFCPVCDTPWEPEDFRRIVTGKLNALEVFTKKRTLVIQQLENLCETLERFSSSLKAVFPHAKLLKPPPSIEEMEIYETLIRSSVTQLRKLLPLSDTLQDLGNVKLVPKGVIEELTKIEQLVNSIPEPSRQDAAREYLIISQERLVAYRQASLRWKKGNDDAKTAKTVYELFCAEVNKTLDKIYKDVETSFIELYRGVNADEETFSAQLIPSAGKLGFDVDFYGRGYFPPGAYHSEGHQDGMGVCLYLALMRHLLKENFTFAVLDDVLMSVDAGHRREVSKMLMELFPDTQFILTTHDEVWLRHMKSAGLIKPGKFVHFRKWSVDLGPTEWEDRDVWQEVDDYVAKNDIRAAASLLRHYLEHVFHEICNRLRATVEFREDGQFELGDLLPSSIGAFNKKLKKGKESAQSWSDKEKGETLSKLETRFKDAVINSQVDQWQVNAAIHYNQWATLGKSDFEIVVKAFKLLVEMFKCDECHGFLYVLPEKGSPEMLRCGCAKTSINLVVKPKEPVKIKAV